MAIDKKGKKRVLADITNTTSDPVPTEEVATADTPETFEAAITAGVSPVTLDINTALGRNATKTDIANNGAGDFTVAISTDGSVFGDEYTLDSGETYPPEILKDLSVNKIRLTHSSDSSYKVAVI